MRVDCVSPIRLLCGIYKSAPRWRKSANDGSKTSCALLHRSRGLVSVSFHGIKKKKKKKRSEEDRRISGAKRLGLQDSKSGGGEAEKVCECGQTSPPFYLSTFHGPFSFSFFLRFSFPFLLFLILNSKKSIGEV
jgi:hypothetical protein